MSRVKTIGDKTNMYMISINLVCKYGYGEAKSGVL